jgi:hypothetical protein
MRADLLLLSQTDGSVIVDFYSYLHYGPGQAPLGQLIPSTDLFEMCQCEVCAKRRGPAQDYFRYKDYDLLKFPPRVLGYSLRQKIWAQFSIENIAHSVWADGVFDRLILNDDYKRMIRAFISSHARRGQGDGPRYVNDVIEGKGQGLVLLLHGTDPEQVISYLINAKLMKDRQDAEKHLLPSR